MESERWRQSVEERWRQKLDEVIALSHACYDRDLVLPDEVAGDGDRAASVKLWMRLYQAHEDLAELEAAIEAVAAAPMRSASSQVTGGGGGAVFQDIEDRCLDTLRTV